VVRELWTKQSFGLKYGAFHRFVKDMEKTLAHGLPQKSDTVAHEKMLNNHHL
jgi:hypothetical protein